MPVKDSSTLLSTIEAFLSHWQLADSKLEASQPLIVLDGVTCEGLSLLREELEAEPAGLARALDEEKLAVEEFKSLRARLGARMKRFNMRVRGFYPGTKWEKSLKRVLTAFAGADHWRPAFEGTLFLWKKINVEEETLRILVDNLVPVYTAEMFEGELAALEAAWAAVHACKVETGLCRAARALLQERAMTVMKAYGHSLKGRLGDGSRVAASLPQLWPGPARGSRRKRIVGEMQT